MHRKVDKSKSHKTCNYNGRELCITKGNFWVHQRFAKESATWFSSGYEWVNYWDEILSSQPKLYLTFTITCGGSRKFFKGVSQEA